MHRQPLLQLLTDYAAANPAEREVAARIESLVTNHADCFDRTCRPGHVTGSAWVLSADRRRCLLLHHRKLQCWLQPGGHADGDPDVANVARREAIEESGLANLAFLQTDGTSPIALDIDVHLIPARYRANGELVEDAHEHHDIRFLLAAEDESPIIVSDESHDVRWFTPTEITQQTDEESVLRLMRKAMPLMG